MAEHGEFAPPMHFVRVLLLSFGLFNLGPMLVSIFRYTNPFHGFLNGLFHVFVFGLVWIVYLLPWSLLIYALYRWRKWSRFRIHWVLAPAILWTLLSIASLIIDPPTAKRRFLTFAGTNLPTNNQDLHRDFTGGGLTDYSDTWYFRTTPDEVDRLILEMKLEPDKQYGDKEISYTPIRPLTGWPDLNAWEGAVQYQRCDEKSGWFYYLITDATRTQVYILIGCI